MRHPLFIDVVYIWECECRRVNCGWWGPIYTHIPLETSHWASSHKWLSVYGVFLLHDMRHVYGDMLHVRLRTNVLCSN